MSKWIGAAAAWRLRTPAATSRETIVTFGVTTVPALAIPGRASPIAVMSRSFLMTTRVWRTVTERSFAFKAEDPLRIQSLQA